MAPYCVASAAFSLCMAWVKVLVILAWMLLVLVLKFLKKSQKKVLYFTFSSQKKKTSSVVYSLFIKIQEKFKYI